MWEWDKDVEWKSDRRWWYRCYSFSSPFPWPRSSVARISFIITTWVSRATCASATAPLQTLPVWVQRSARWVHLNDTCCNTEVFAMVASKKQHQDYHCVGGSCVELFHNEGCQDIGEECLRDDDCCEGSYCCDYMVCSSIHWIPKDSQSLPENIFTAIYKAHLVLLLGKSSILSLVVNIFECRCWKLLTEDLESKP